MRKSLIPVIIIASVLCLPACKTPIGSADDMPMHITGSVQSDVQERFEIYPTMNMFNSLKLDTRTGVVHRIQWTVKDDENMRYEVPVSESVLVRRNQPHVNGRFKLIPTDNIYNFILLDTIDGRVWQLQWSFEEENNFIIPIN